MAHFPEKQRRPEAGAIGPAAMKAKTLREDFAAESQVERPFIAVPIKRHFHRLSDLQIRVQIGREVDGVLNLVAVDADDDVAFLNPGALGGAA